MCSYNRDYDTGFSDYVECCEASDANSKLYNIELMMDQVIKMLYSDQKLDVASLDDSIGQICDCLGIAVPANLPKVRRQGSDLFEFAASINY